MVAVCALSAFLAVRQNALPLAFMGTAGGFLAPVLLSTGQGNHVALFSYYALLNAGIFAIAWFKAWRPLNLLGFVFTFTIGSAWGVTAYRPALFASTEPFLILFFLMYVGIALLYAVKRELALRHYVDGTLVFGTPIVATALQASLVKDMPFGNRVERRRAVGVLRRGHRVLARRRDRLALLFRIHARARGDLRDAGRAARVLRSDDQRRVGDRRRGRRLARRARSACCGSASGC